MIKTTSINEIAKLFGSTITPELFSGGQGTTFRSGGIVLKPAHNQTECEGMAELLSMVSSTNKIRIPKPIWSKNNNWVEHGYAAWEYMEGEDITEHYEEKMELCDLFSGLFEGFSKPNFLDQRTDPWAIADRAAWEEIDREYDDVFQPMVENIAKHLVPITMESCIIHDDIDGNTLFHKHLPPAVIDITLAWRPKHFAHALLALDIITWENDNAHVYASLEHIPDINQLLLRAGLRRVIEKTEQVRLLGWDREERIAKAKRYVRSLELLGLVT